MKMEYYSLLINELKLKPSNFELSSSIKQDMTCLICNHIFSAIPKGKVMNYNRFKTTGCSKCTIKKRYASDVDSIKHRLHNMGYILHEPYTNNKTPILVSNSKCCNRVWRTRVDNIFTGNCFCRPCNDDLKRKRLEEANEKRYQEAAARLTGCDRYRLTVRYLSEKNYRANFAVLNPDNKLRRRSGSKGVHLDHIVPIVWCFRNNIPENICAHSDNLRIINSKWNAKKWSKLPKKFPAIFNPYVNK